MGWLAAILVLIFGGVAYAIYRSMQNRALERLHQYTPYPDNSTATDDSINNPHRLTTGETTASEHFGHTDHASGHSVGHSADTGFSDSSSVGGSSGDSGGGGDGGGGGGD